MIASLKFLLFCIGVAIIYGIVHDQVTARVCIEYFTIGHPHIFDTDSPTILAFTWGILATWWAGLLLGVLLLGSATIGRWPHYHFVKLRRSVVVIMLIAAPLALLAGVAGYLIADAWGWSLPESLASRIAADRHALFVADLFAHNTSYAVAMIGSIILCIRVVAARIREGRELDPLRMRESMRGDDDGCVIENR